MLDAAMNIITGPLGAALAGIVAVLGALVWGRRKGAQDERQKREAQDARDYHDTRRRIDDALDGTHDDDGTLRDWLRERGRKR